jgi:5-methylcytosine-specific restriction protein A
MKNQPRDPKDERRTSSTQRGYGSRWQRARKTYLFAHPLCALCQQDGKLTPATVVHHTTPHKGDSSTFWDSSSWQSLCKPHHDREAQRYERGTPVQKVGQDGWPIEA